MKKRTNNIKINHIKFIFCIVASILSISLPIYAEHSHKETCYSQESHTHDETCYTKKYHSHTQECVIDSCSNFPRTMSSNIADGICPNCQENSLMTISSTCVGCNASSSYTKCVNCETIISGEELDNHQTITIDYALSKGQSHLKCGKDSNSYIEELSCGKEETTYQGNLICNTTIMYIYAQEESQIETLNSNVIVVYADEHEEIKNATNNYDSNKTYNGEEIILSYNGFNCSVFFYSSNESNIIINKEDVITNNKIENDLFNNEESVGINIQDEIIEKKEENILQDETIEIIDEVINKEEIEFERELGLKDTIIMELEEEVETTENTSSIENITNNNTILSFVIIVFLIGVLIIIFFVFKTKKNKN